MTEVDATFAGSIPDVYDNLLVPLIFEDFAADLATRVTESVPLAILETAAGSGVVARALTPLLAPGTRYCVTDLSQAMLDRAASRQPADPRIQWRQADAQALPFADAEFDVVCCQFGVMFFPDRLAAFREARRVLRPGGRFLFSTWDSISENAFADLVTRVAAEIFPDDPPQFLARTPHGYHDQAPILADLTAAGFTAGETVTLALTSTAPTPLHPAMAYAQGTPLRSEIEARDPEALELLTDIAAYRIATAYGPGPVSAPIKGHVFLATA